MSFAGPLAISVGYIILKHRAWDSRPCLPPPPTTYLVPAVVTVVYFSDFFSLRLSEVLYQVSVVYRIGTHPSPCRMQHNAWEANIAPPFNTISSDLESHVRGCANYSAVFGFFIGCCWKVCLHKSWQQFQWDCSWGHRISKHSGLCLWRLFPSKWSRGDRSYKTAVVSVLHVSWIWTMKPYGVYITFCTDFSQLIRMLLSDILNTCCSVS